MAASVRAYLVVTLLAWGPAAAGAADPWTLDSETLLPVPPETISSNVYDLHRDGSGRLIAAAAVQGCEGAGPGMTLLAQQLCVYTSMDDGLTFTECQKVACRYGSSFSTVRVGSLPDTGELLVSWREDAIDGDKFLSRSTDAGNTWSDPLEISGPSGSPGTSTVAPTREDRGVSPFYMDMTADRRRGVFVVWTEGDGVLAQSTDGGVTFAHTVLPDSGGYVAVATDERWIGSDETPTLFIAYTHNDVDADPLQVWLVRSADGGRSLSSPIRVSGARAARQSLVDVSLATGPRGQVLALWSECCAEEEGANAHQVRLARSTDGGRSFAPDAAVGAGPDPRDDQRQPAIDIDATGRLLVAWRAAGDGPAVYAAISWDGGVSFRLSGYANVGAGQGDRPAIALADETGFLLLRDVDSTHFAVWRPLFVPLAGSFAFVVLVVGLGAAVLARR